MNQSCIPNPMPKTCMLYGQYSDLSAFTSQTAEVSSAISQNIYPDGQWVQINPGSPIEQGYGISITSVSGLVSTCGNDGYEDNAQYIIDASKNLSVVTRNSFGQTISVKAGDIIVAEIQDPDENSTGGSNKVKDVNWDISTFGKWDPALWVPFPQLRIIDPIFCCYIQDPTDSDTQNPCAAYVQGAAYVKDDVKKFNQICGLTRFPYAQSYDNCWSIKGWGADLVVTDATGKNAQISILAGGFGTVNTPADANNYALQGQSNITAAGILGFRFSLDPTKSYVGNYNIAVKHVGCPALSGVANPYNNKGDILFYFGPDVSDSEKEKNATSLKLNNYYTASQQSNAYVKINADDQKFYNSRSDSLSKNIVVNNLGYVLKGQTKNLQYPISQFVNEITEFVRGKIVTTTQNIYENGTCTGNNNSSTCFAYITIIKLLLVLYITITGVFFAIGAAEISQKDLVIRAIKIGAVLSLLQQKSWDFFSQYFLNLFIYGTDVLLSNAAANIMGTGGNKWGFIDSVLILVFYNPGFIYQTLALIFSSFFGIFLFFMILWSLFLLLKAFFAAVKSYIFSIVVIGFLVAMTPIFVPFLLFSYTKEMFDSWWKAMAKFAFEPVMLIASMSILSQMIFNIIRKIMAYGVCWNCLLGIPNTTICLEFFQIWGLGAGVAGDRFVFEIFGLTVSFFIIAKMMDGLHQVIFDISGHLLSAGGRRDNSSLRPGLLNMTGEGSLFYSAAKSLNPKSLFGMDDTSRSMRRAVRGEIANQVRNEMVDRMEREEEEARLRRLPPPTGAVPGGGGAPGGPGGGGPGGGGPAGGGPAGGGPAGGGPGSGGPGSGGSGGDGSGPTRGTNPAGPGAGAQTLATGDQVRTGTRLGISEPLTRGTQATATENNQATVAAAANTQNPVGVQQPQAQLQTQERSQGPQAQPQGQGQPQAQQGLTQTSVGKEQPQAQQGPIQNPEGQHPAGVDTQGNKVVLNKDGIPVDPDTRNVDPKGNATMSRGNMTGQGGRIISTSGGDATGGAPQGSQSSGQTRAGVDKKPGGNE